MQEHTQVGLTLALISITLLAGLTTLAIGTNARKGAIRRLYQRLSIRIKGAILLWINELLMPCKKYHRRPPVPLSRCEMCAQEGGWRGCRRSRQLKPKSNIIEEAKQEDETHR